MIDVLIVSCFAATTAALVFVIVGATRDWLAYRRQKDEWRKW